MIGSAKPDLGAALASSTALAFGHRTTMLVTAKLARHFSAARVARPARYISTSSARRSDALFVVRLLRCPWTFPDSPYCQRCSTGTSQTTTLGYRSISRFTSSPSYLFSDPIRVHS